MTRTDDNDHLPADEMAYEPLGRPRGGMSKGVVTLLAAMCVVGIISAATLVWMAKQINPSSPVGDPVGSLVIPGGATLDDVADLLAEEDVVGSARAFGWYASFKDVLPPQAGEYVQFKENLPMADVVELLNAGPVAPESVVVTIIPGTWFSDALVTIADAFPAIEAEDLVAALASGQVTSKYLPPDAENWEGFLLPETHEFSSDSSAVDVLQTLVDETDDTLDALGYENALALTGHDAYDLVTIASMIERETGDVPDERGKIAQVIFNRLDAGTPLGIDATVLYGLQRRGGSDDPLTKSDLENDTPYNSRINAGLPPTPISLPSAQSLEAAINPIDGPWIYYVLVSDDPREHLFTASYSEFEQAKARAREEGLT